MASNHYVNYFGKVTNIESIKIKPLLFEKGKTKVAIYGLGHMKDQRLNQAFDSKSIIFERPNQNKDDWFNILVIHQNRYKGLFLGCQKRDSIMDSQIPNFFDLVIWGHEHQCIPEAWQCKENEVYFLQPGSTVATSLIDDESKQKHCFTLKVKQREFTLKPIPLKTVRPLFFNQIELFKSQIDFRRQQLVENFIK